MDKNNINIFILAGGFGTRLRSVVNDVPKPMAPILNIPFLEYQIKEIRKYFPSSRIYLLTHYLSEIIEDYFRSDKSIIVLKEKKPLGTGGSIKNAINQLQLIESESILVFNGDTYIAPDLNSMVKNSKNKISILGSLQNNCDRYGTLIIENNFITNFNEKKVGINNSYINAGCYYFNNLEFFTKIKEEIFAIEDKFKEYLLNKKIDLFRYHDIFIDIGIPEDYDKMIKYIKDLNNGER
ncbi:sugar phosphate nucleotidyltransferase [Sulfurimonas sp.]|uniref:sugar phosphate nucleotidyltransferase n=1 Tax=Sulfurimonas sp. TaxID=2022749 RepID=UPI0025D29C29|nr:sugar phosphate nucleotidyltransferase [Sulfurimonas sp.]